MARLQKDVVSYFPHDANASEGDTMTILQSRFGNNGYAFWFKLLEKLASSEGHFIDLSNPIKWQLFIAKMGTDEITTVEIIKLLVEMKAIDGHLWESRLIWCQKLVDNVADVYSNRRRNLPSKPTNTRGNPITTTDNLISSPASTQSKVKESKVKESKVNNTKNIYGEFKNVLLTNEEKDKLIEKFGEQGFNERVESLSCGIKSKGYKYKDHYATILSWQRMDDKREAEKSGTHRKDTQPEKETLTERLKRSIQ